MTERILPQNVEAEQGLLGSILIDPEVYDLVADRFKPEDFYRDAHRIIYHAMVSLRNQSMSPDYLTICDELERTGKLEQAMGADYITLLINRVPTSGNVSIMPVSWQERPSIVN